jgi:hypothetical protein
MLKPGFNLTVRALRTGGILEKQAMQISKKIHGKKQPFGLLQERP